MNLTEQVARFVSQTTYDDLPQEVIHQAKRCLLDGLGALVAGTATPVAEMMASFARDHFASGGEAVATILVKGSRVSPVGAALANGFAANALDIDDGYRLVKGHPGACVLPVVIAASELVPETTGADFLAALVVAYETAIRAGMVRHSASETYHTSGSWGSVGGAAGAAKLLKCDPEYEKAFPQKTLADATIETTGAKQHLSGPVEPKWEPPNYPSDDELERKFYWLVEPILGYQQTTRLTEMIWSLEQLGSVRDLLQLAVRLT